MSDAPLVVGTSTTRRGDNVRLEIVDPAARDQVRSELEKRRARAAKFGVALVEPPVADLLDTLENVAVKKVYLNDAVTNAAVDIVSGHCLLLLRRHLARSPAAVFARSV